MVLISLTKERRPIEVNDSVLEELLKEDPRRDLSQLNFISNTVLNRLKAFGSKVQKMGS